jgi:hypothetical protein
VLSGTHFGVLLRAYDCVNLALTRMVSPENLTRNSPFLVERRREPRVTQPGSVNITVSQSDAAITFPAAVVDASGGGMCIRHWRKELAIGEEVKVSSIGSDGQSDPFRATVAWNWTVGPVVMSGLEKCNQQHQLNLNAPRTFTKSNGKIAKVSSLLWASLTVLVVVLGWFFIKIW